MVTMTSTKVSSTPTFRAGGLASGLDSASIIDSLVAIQTAPITKLQQTQSIIDIKISSLGALSSKLQAFDQALKDLASTGAHGVSVAQAPASATITAGPTAQAGRTTLEVTQLAQAAKVRSAGQTPGAALTAGTFHIDADGKGYDINVTAGMQLGDIASAIKASGAPVSAAVINDGTHQYLSVARLTTGFTIGGTPASALSISGAAADALGFTTIVDAKNAKFSLDGLAMERTSNDVTDALPGVSLSLKAPTTAPEDFVIADDPTQTKTNLQKMVDAYNQIESAVQGELDIKADTDRSKTLAGDPTLQLIQARMHALLTNSVGTGSVKTLADIGLKTAKDGSLSIDDTTFNRVVAANPTAVDDLVKGISPVVTDMVSTFTDVVNGALTVDSQGLADQKKRMGDQVTELQARADQYKEQLVAQFTAMEKVVSDLKNVGNFLTSQSNAQSSSGK